MITIIFRLTIFIILTTTVIVVITPLVTLNNLLHPLKIDSIYVNQQQFTYEQSLTDSQRDTREVFLYTPSQLNLKYIDINFRTSDSINLKGWIALDTLKTKSPLLLIIPDISEGAINYLPAMKQFCDRGFNVCVMDMRGQGHSEGTNYDFTKRSADDLVQLVTQLKLYPFVEYVAVMGNRTGAAIVIKAEYDSASFADVLVLQNPPKSLKRLLIQQAIEEWGEFIQVILPALGRSYEQQVGISIADYNYASMVKKFYTPQMMVAANYKSKSTVNETISVYQASEYFRKVLFIENASYNKPTGFENSKKYYDKISGFINSSLPSKSKKTRFRKLAAK